MDQNASKAFSFISMLAWAAIGGISLPVLLWIGDSFFGFSTGTFLIQYVNGHDLMQLKIPVLGPLIEWLISWPGILIIVGAILAVLLSLLFFAGLFLLPGAVIGSIAYILVLLIKKNL